MLRLVREDELDFKTGSWQYIFRNLEIFYLIFMVLGIEFEALSVSYVPTPGENFNF